MTTPGSDERNSVRAQRVLWHRWSWPRALRSGWRSRRALRVAMGGLLVAFLTAGEPAAAPTLELRIQVLDLRNSVGLVRLALFDRAEGYPESNELAAATLSSPIDARPVTLRFRNLEPGTYALSVLHDENKNGRLDRNLVGIPMEGIGASNDATRRWGPPRFEDAKFELEVEGQTLIVRMRYFM